LSIGGERNYKEKGEKKNSILGGGVEMRGEIGAGVELRAAFGAKIWGQNRGPKSGPNLGHS